jgi:chromosome segregation ATPase
MALLTASITAASWVHAAERQIGDELVGLGATGVLVALNPERIELIGLRLREARHEIDGATAEEAAQRRQVADTPELQARLLDLERQLADARRELEGIHGKSVGKELARLRKLNTELKRQVTAAIERKQQRKEFDDSVKKLAEDQDRFQKQKSQLEGELEAAKSQIVLFEYQVGQTKREKEQMGLTIARAESEKEKLTRSLNDATQQRADQERNVKQLERRRREAEERTEQKTKIIEEQRARLSGLALERQGMLRQVKRVKELEAKIKRLESERAAFREESGRTQASFKSDMARLQVELDQWKTIASDLRQQVETEEIKHRETLVGNADLRQRLDEVQKELEDERKKAEENARRLEEDSEKLEKSHEMAISELSDVYTALRMQEVSLEESEARQKDATDAHMARVAELSKAMKERNEAQAEEARLKTEVEDLREAAQRLRQLHDEAQSKFKRKIAKREALIDDANAALQAQSAEHERAMADERFAGDRVKAELDQANEQIRKLMQNAEVARQALGDSVLYRT